MQGPQTFAHELGTSRRAKRSRSASDSQVTTFGNRSDTVMFLPATVGRDVADFGTRTTGSHIHTRSVAGGNSMHPAGTIPNPAVLESFRPFLQQLAAGIVAGFTTTKAQSSATGGATAAGQAASKLPSTSTAAGTAPKEGLPPLPHIPQPMMQQVMLMMAKAGSCGIIQPGSSQPQLPRAPDAVAVVCRRGTKQPSSKKELGVAAIGIQGGKGAVQSSAVAGQAMGTGSVPFYQKQMQHSSSSSSLQTQQAPPRPQISAVALDLRCIQPQQHNRNCVIHASETEYAAAATGSAALGLPNDTTPAAPPPTPASVPAVSPMTVPSAAGAQKINSIRQHIMLLETSLGNMSPQVASAYLFLADVLQREGSQWSIHHAARARARAQEISGALGQQQQQQLAPAAATVSVGAVGRQQAMKAVGQQ